MRLANNNAQLLLTRAEASALCSCHPTTFSRWVATGLMPRALPGLRRWSRAELEAKIAGLVGANDNVASDPYLAWKASDAG